MHAELPAAAETAASEISRPGRLLSVLWGLAVLATIAAVGQHLAEALTVVMPASGAIGERLAAVPALAWVWAALHLLAALLALPLGYRVISLAYPLRGLGGLAADNPAAAIQAAAHLLGATVIACVSWGGCDAPSLLVSAVFCALGWVTLAVISAGHRLVTRYRDHEEIAAGNTAAAIASAGLHLAFALVVGHAILGQFSGWSESLRGFAGALVWVLLLYPLRQLVLARLLLRLAPRELDAAIAGRRDIWLGSAEAMCYLLAALALAGW